MEFLHHIDAKHQLISTVATGTAPLVIASTTAVANLNVDMLDGKHASEFATSSHNHNSLYASLTHSHAISDVTSLQTSLDSKQGKVITVTCDTASATLAKEVIVPDYTLATGDMFAIKFSAGTSVSNPTLSVNGGAAVGIQLGSTNASTTTLSVGAGGVALMFYDGEYFRLMGSHDTSDSTESYTVRWSSTHKAGAAIYDYKIVMFGVDGLIYPLTLENGTGSTKTVSTQEFMLGSPVLYYGSTTDLAEGATSSSYWYNSVSMSTLEYTANQSSGFTAYAPIYLKGTITASGNFKLDNTTYTSWLTQTLPTTEDGFVYILVGFMYNTTDALRLVVNNPMYEYKDGKLRFYTASHSHVISDVTGLQSALDGKSNTSHTHSYLPLSGGSLTGPVTITRGTTGDILTLLADPTELDVSLYLGIAGDANSYRLTYHGTGAGNTNDISLNSSTATLFRSHQDGIVNFPVGLQKGGVDVSVAGHGHAWSDVSSTPTTLVGYGITDAATSTHNHTLDSLSNTTITSIAAGEILKWSGSAWINNTLTEAGIAASGHTHDSSYAPLSHTQAWSTITSKPTTLGGYGITDAATSTHNHDASYTAASHAGATGSAHGAVTNLVNGFMIAADKTKLDGIASGATANTGTVTSIAAGNGLSFTTITGSGSVTLGTPSTLTAATTNGVTSTSHTHAVTATDAGAASTIVKTDSSGDITANSAFKMGTAATMQYNATTKSIDFIFA